MTRDEAIKQNRKFAYTVAIALMVLAVLRIFIKHQNSWWLWGVAAILLLLALLKPLWLDPLRLAWDKIGHVLGIINTYILLTLFYFLILTPLSMIMRLFNKDILKLKRTGQDSYWENAPPKAEGSGMENQF